MKIALNMGNEGVTSTKAAQAKVLEKDIEAAKKGDWTAKNNLIRTFTPLLASLAEKRTKDIAKMNDYIDAGKEGLLKATKKFNPSHGGDKFHIFVVGYIESAMDKHEKGGGFFARLFGR